MVIRHTLFNLLVAWLALGGLSAVHAETPVGAPPPAKPFVEVAEVARWLREGTAIVFDANGADTRKREGVVPGARLLPHFKDYDPAAVLPADKNTRLVFYCRDERCRAADGAAETARKAGHRDVRIMRAGIAGWNKAHPRG